MLIKNSERHTIKIEYEGRNQYCAQHCEFCYFQVNIKIRQNGKFSGNKTWKGKQKYLKRKNIKYAHFVK